MAGAAVGALATSFCNPAAEELGKCFVEMIKRPFSYLFCFDSNIQSLRDEAQRLKDKRDGLRGQVDNEENNARQIVPRLITWLSATEQNLVEAEQIENDVRNAQNGSWTIRSRYSLSKKARETAEKMKELRNDSTFDPISLPAPPPAQASVPNEETREFESRKRIEEGVLKALQDKKVTKIGICGIGGVGKTTMAEKVNKRVKELNLFDETPFATVSKPVDMFQIQLQIAEQLHLKLEEETLRARAHRLRERLTGPKRILIVLDDIGGELKLEDLGIIPGESAFEGRCTTLLTSRDRHVLRRMGAEPFELGPLPKEEAWCLFKDKAGACVDNLNLKSIAKKVVGECGGLPVAIVTVGSALKDKQQILVWEDALERLKTVNPEGISDLLQKVYNPLRLSYESLEDPDAKSLFFLCCLFPEDFNISLELLTWYSMELRLFPRINNLQDATRRVYAVVDLLKSRYLLLDSKHRHHVKMHDVIRDVAIFFASEERLADVHHRSRDVDWQWISVFSETNDEFRDYLTGGSNKLCFLARGPAIPAILGPKEIKDFSLLEGMKQLSVLSLYSISFKSLPETIQSLENLRILCLERCSVETISAVGQLLSLEVLSCCRCFNIEELPADIGRLERLKSLDISNCRRLSRIAPGIISKLFKLEVLKMRDSFKGWESANVKEEERRNASLKELESLSQLRHLEIEIADVNLVAEELRLSSNIVKYFIDVGKGFSRFFHWVPPFDKDIRLKLPREIINLGGWTYEFVRSTERLCLEGPNLELICEGPIPYGSNSFNNLKELRPGGLPALKHLWKSPNQHVSLCNLRKMIIQRCHSLQNLFLLGTAEDGLPQLESLKIEECDEMKEVFSNEENEEDRKKSDVTFPKLRKLKLTNLPSLQTFCRGEVESIEFPVLEALNIRGCPKLRSMVSPVESNQNRPNHNDDDQSLHLFCNEKVKFGGLKRLEMRGYNDIRKLWCQQISLHFFWTVETLVISDCHGIKSLFSSLTYENFVNLGVLIIENCNQMKKVIANEADEKSILFPKLYLLSLNNLPLLEIFCEWKCVVELPLLRTVFIEACQKMQHFTRGPPSTPNLDCVGTDEGEITKKLNERGALNRVVRHHVYHVYENEDEISTSTEDDEEESEREEESSKEKEKDKERIPLPHTPSFHSMETSEIVSEKDIRNIPSSSHAPLPTINEISRTKDLGENPSATAKEIIFASRHWYSG